MVTIQDLVNNNKEVIVDKILSVFIYQWQHSDKIEPQTLDELLTEIRQKVRREMQLFNEQHSDDPINF